jgi:hypothetical protein
MRNILRRWVPKQSTVLKSLRSSFEEASLVKLVAVSQFAYTQQEWSKPVTRSRKLIKIILIDSQGSYANRGLIVCGNILLLHVPDNTVDHRSHNLVRFDVRKDAIIVVNTKNPLHPIHHHQNVSQTRS